jgi:hypothetical protein
VRVRVSRDSEVRAFMPDESYLVYANSGLLASGPASEL